MEKVLGLDLGTNSIGWAIVQHNDDLSYSLLDKGVNIFQDGVAHDKSGEKPMVSERTAARSSRRHYFRRRLRKIELLNVLVKYDLCPYLSEEELSEWKNHKKYPLKDEFLEPCYLFYCHILLIRQSTILNRINVRESLFLIQC